MTAKFKGQLWQGRFWYVFEGDWGGQIYATIPASLVPNLTAGQAQEFLRTCDQMAWEYNNGEGASVYMLADAGYVEPDYRGLTEAQRVEAELVAFLQMESKRLELEPFGMRPARIFEGKYSCPLGLADWELVGGETGGMGGGALLANDLWLHNEFLLRGLGLVNRLRAMLGLAPLPPNVELVVDGTRCKYLDYVRWLREPCKGCNRRTNACPSS